MNAIFSFNVSKNVFNGFRSESLSVYGHGYESIPLYVLPFQLQLSVYNSDPQ